MIYRLFALAVLCLLLGLVQGNDLKADDLVINSTMQYDYAQEMFMAREFEIALVEFKRYVHFFPGSKKADQAQLNAAMCLFHLKKYHDAARAFNEIILTDRQADITREAVFYQSQAFLNLGNFAYAQIVLQNYLKLAEDTDTQDKIYFNLVLIHLAEARAGQADSLHLASKYLSRISASNADTYNTSAHEDLIFRAVHAPRKNPKAAGLLSILPGGGFFYCERYQDALVTFLLNAGLIAAACQAYDDDNPALSAIIGFVETGFYMGNIYGAITSAHKFNRMQVMKILDKDLSLSFQLIPKTNGYGISLNYPF